MSNYNNYAQELNKAFLTAAAAYNNAYQDYQTAEQAAKEATDPVDKITTAAALTKAKEEMKKAHGVWTDFQKTRDSLGKKLAADVDKAQTANPDDLDNNAVTLLNSGTMDAADLEEMANKYANNPTMLHLVSKAANDLAESTKDPDIHSRMNVLSTTCKKQSQPAVLKNWDNLVDTSAHYSGEYQRNPEPGVVCGLADHWNDDNVQTALNNF